jgi:hypothetical protein
MSRDYIQKTFGVAPIGLWPSEGSVSDHVLDLAASLGFQWAATDNGVLERTLRRPATPDVAYRPWIWSQHDRSMRMIFRDHQLSDLIGFVYSGLGAADAASDFLRRIQDNCHGLLSSGRDALVPIILDGENAWEYYDHNGRPFFRELYSRIQNDSSMEAITVSEAFQRVEAEPMGHIFPGSWINANFDVWIGAEEDNKSWQLLLEARRAYEEAANVPEDRRRQALEELLIAEGSDWNWWYGPEHSSENRVEFDQIYREHLANVYRALGIAAPDELSEPILRLAVEEIHTPPLGYVRAQVNGVIDSYFEWLGAGIYKVDARSGSMHGKRSLVQEVHYGVDTDRLFLRIDFTEPGSIADMDVIAEINGTPMIETNKLTIRITRGELKILSGAGEAAFRDVLEIAVPGRVGAKVRLSFWQDGLPVQSVPPQDYLLVTAPDPGV